MSAALMRGPRPYLEIFLLSLGVILLEVSYTRIFSYKLVYYFTYLIIGLALLGLGSGGVLVVVSGRLRRVAAERVIPACGAVAAAGVLGGYLLVALVQLNTLDLVGSIITGALGMALREFAKLTLICFALFVPFCAAGLAIAKILASHADHIDRLYFADLLGAATGCAVAIPLMYAIWPTGCVWVAGGSFALAGLRLAHAEGLRARFALLALAAVLVTGAVFPARLPDTVPDRMKATAPQHISPDGVLFSRWSPVFRVDVAPTIFHKDETRMLYHDGMPGSVLARFDGDISTLTRYDSDPRAYPFPLLRPAPRVAIIGSAGGNEILASLHFGAAHVTAIELNPVTVSLLTTHFADYSGHLAENARVTLVNAEGRSFLGGDDNRYDLIWFVAPDSYAAMNAASSGAYVLSESYLYTVEMIEESLAHLAPDGLICAQFGEVNFDRKPNRTARYLATARDAFARRGIGDFPRHVLLGTSFTYLLQSSTILLKSSPFTAEEVARFEAETAALERSSVRHAWTRPPGDNPVNQVISLPADALARWYGENAYAVDPVTDDSPFFWHFVRFRDLLRGRAATLPVYNWEEGMGERLLLVLLATAALFAAAFLLVPMLAIRSTWRALPHKTRASVFFAAIGTGFMFLEVTLIQRFTLFLGYPTYSLTVTLLALLLSTGAGSLASARWTSPRALSVLAAVLCALVLFYEVGLTPILVRGVGWPLPVRVATAVVLLVPLGLCLGAFLPLGMRRITALTPHREEFVAWGWAVNGFASVVSSVLATILAMSFGFRAVMLLALGVYLIGIAALRGIGRA